MIVKLEQKLRRYYENVFFSNRILKYKLFKKLGGWSGILCCNTNSLKACTRNFQKYDILFLNPHKRDSEKVVPFLAWQQISCSNNFLISYRNLNVDRYSKMPEQSLKRGLLLKTVKKLIKKSRQDASAKR